MILCDLLVRYNGKDDGSTTGKTSGGDFMAFGGLPAPWIQQIWW